MATLELTNEEIVTRLLTSNEILKKDSDKPKFSYSEIRLEEEISEPSKYMFIRQ